ncbi:MAG: LamG-like jellyroll fold domain-containing protein [Planctomycetota bacterium]|nr:LamG-like jellyroll fold domain-containing protein [Planctomycetota bacterium]
MLLSVRARFVGVVSAAVASLAGAQPVESVSYVELDGVDDSVVSYADFTLTTLTAEAWVRVDSSHEQFASGIVTWGSRDQGSYSFAIRSPSDRRLTFFINFNNGTQRTLTGNTPLPPGEWHHVAATYDGTTARLYIDAVLDAEGVLGDPINPTDDPGRLSIGDEFAGQSEFVRGGFDDVMIWSEARTAEQIADDMAGNGGKNGGSALMAWYRFDEFASNIVLDSSGNGRHAHLGADFDVGDDDPVSVRWDEGLSRRRYLVLTSSRQGEVRVISGSLEDQIAQVNAGSNQSFWAPIVNRHADFHERDSFLCTAAQDLSFVDSETYLTGADEVTRHNCESAFYRFDFYMPPMYLDAQVYGVANLDDMGVVFMNGSAISPTIEQEDLDNFGTDRLDAAGRPVLGWPTADPLFASDHDLFVPGKNEFLVAVASDVSEFEPAGMEFIVVVAYDCLADWNADGEHDTVDFTEFLNAWASGDPGADVNLDGSVNTKDFILWLNIWSFGCPD